MTQTNTYPPPPVPQDGGQSQQVLSYAHAVPMTNLGGVWRDGKMMVTTKEAVLPTQCVKCGQPGRPNYWVKKKFYWHHPAFYLMIIFPGLLIYAIVAMCIRKSATVNLSMCDRHRSARIRNITLAWVCGLAFLPMLICGAVLTDQRSTATLGGVIMVLSLVTLIMAVVFGNFAKTLVPKKIDEQYAWFSGPGEYFLQTLPPVR